MLAPAELIADLDAALAEDGEDVSLVRNAKGPNGTLIPTAVTVRASIRPALTLKAQELTGTVSQQEDVAIFSPTQIVAAGWTSGRPSNEDQRVPQKDNVLVIAGRHRMIEAADGIYVRGELVRIVARMLG